MSAATTLSLNCTIVIFTNVLFYYYRFFIHGMIIHSLLFLCWKESDRTENMINLYLVTIFKFTGAESRKIQSLLVVQSLTLCSLRFSFSFIQYIDLFHKGIEKKRK